MQDPEQKLLEEMQGVKDNMTKRQKREKKKKIEAKRKYRLRAAQLDKSKSFRSQIQLQNWPHSS